MPGCVSGTLGKKMEYRFNSIEAANLFAAKKRSEGYEVNVPDHDVAHLMGPMAIGDVRVIVSPKEETVIREESGSAIKKRNSFSPSTHISYNDFYYFLLSIGFLFIAINLSINYAQVLLPTFIGYGIIALCTWNLRTEDVFLRYTPYLAAFLAVLSFPDTFLDAIYADSTAEDAASLDMLLEWRFYFYTLIHAILFGSIAFALFRIAKTCSKVFLQKLWLSLAVIVVLFESITLLIHEPSPQLLLFEYLGLSAYCFAFSWAAYRSSKELPA